MTKAIIIAALLLLATGCTQIGPNASYETVEMEPIQKREYEDWNMDQSDVDDWYLIPNLCR
jgi:heat shock protein HslJ